MSELRECPRCKGSVWLQRFNVHPSLKARIICSCGIEMRASKRDSVEDLIERWNTRAERTCNYFPDEYQTAFDENDDEIETGEASCDGCDYSCDNCGFMMLGGDDGGWFKETPGEYGGWNYEPRFNYCPNCGARVTR